MSGIYFHIPFCKQACHYCNFHFSTSLAGKKMMIAAMQKEIILSKSFLPDHHLARTVYFGGGTPSLMDIAEIQSLLATAADVYGIESNAEITLEANPDDITDYKLNEWKRAGINRLSVGIQSFKEEDLQWMNRAHNAAQARDCVIKINEAGFTNYSVDLIYGTPTLSDEDWIKNIETVIDLKIPHISCYALTVEPSTALHKMIVQKKKADVDPEKQARHFLLLIKALTGAGYEHYEISNFALPGYRSRHNSSYWQGSAYIGIGPSAHSFNGTARRWNISNNALYIKSLEQNIIPFEEEKLSATQQLNEYIMTSLRTTEGLDLKMITKKYGEEKVAIIKNGIKKFQEQNHIIIEEEKIILSNEGKLFADGIAADLFFTDS